MGTRESFAPELEALIGQTVVVDTRGPFVYIGTLSEVTVNTLLLSEVDVHNTEETRTSNDLYLIQTCKDGIRVNRRSAYVLAKDVISVSLLSDIVVY